MWAASHGLLHLPTTDGLRLELITWCWSKLSKSLRRLIGALTTTAHADALLPSRPLVLPDAADADLLPAPARQAALSFLDSQQLSRLQHVCDQLSAALGLDQHASKPLQWRLGGHPQLPASARLQHSLKSVEALCRVVFVGQNGFQVDAFGRPAGLAAAGIELDLEQVKNLEQLKGHNTLKLTFIAVCTLLRIWPICRVFMTR